MQISGSHPNFRFGSELLARVRHPLSRSETPAQGHGTNETAANSAAPGALWTYVRSAKGVERVADELDRTPDL